MKPIVLTEHNWLKLKYHLLQTQPKSVMLTRWKMREVLGFTDRRHREFYSTTGYQTVICLDFYDEAKKTFFLLKYSDWIRDENSHSR